ncbi:hypothetical protein [Microbacterium sp. NPDC089696]|uniref:hypothetical protein n=1 Tax=Microbacterium sp. NPDC089696 TaxID=3364199 RepID=UPI0037F5912A
MTALTIISGDLAATSHEEAVMFCRSHPAIETSAPRWARVIEFIEILDNGEATFRYYFDDEKFTISDWWFVDPDGTLTYGDQPIDDEPEITCKDDSLLEMVTAYVESLPDPPRALKRDPSVDERLRALDE